MTPKALILTGYGINCDIETQYAFRLAGAEAERVHLTDLINGKRSLSEFQIMAFPGGFSFGDDIASGKVLANMVRYNIGYRIRQFIDDGNLIIGICNGFQAMVKMGLLPAFDCNYEKQDVTLTFNDSGRFEDRWVHLEGNADSKCVFTKGIEKIYLPVRHGEGKFVVKDDSVLERLKSGSHIAFKYVDKNGNPAGYPSNPNGSVDNIAGICDETGRVFGMMPHPEAFLHRTNHPAWTREDLPEEGAGAAIFRNAVEYVNENKYNPAHL
ncbi:MAG: phosphoribosylformylglycinamidine synthase I [Candidatus Methanoperedens sp.]|nr:phosphoribosylformylglycinamidine synthase I [Candidatus Methanoperedens sp.]PKL52904.1 MAG: phosphoribosylformylglycinamidine synthase I [Candidatus Methanoperedenaceae archaeon HGW-Methanoperedenaceae-1]